MKPRAPSPRASRRSPRTRPGARSRAAGGDGAESGGLHGELEWELGPDTLAEERAALAGAAARYLEYRLETRSLAPEDPILAGSSAVRSFGAALEAAGPGHATSVAWRRAAPRLRVLCLEPERELGALFARCRAVVAFSATLRPFAMRRELLGLAEERTDELAVPSPFPPERRAVVIEKRADTRWRSRAREAPRLARRLAAFVSAVPGHVLALAPSFAWIEALRGALPATGRLVLAQAAGDGPAERERLLAALAAPAEPPVVLLAAAGGFFGEGVEWPGSLAGVAVLGPCLPPPDLVRELLRRRYEERFGDGFALAYGLPGMTRVIQGAGRLIRSEHDRGVVALFDRRFLAEPWRDLLPREWLAGGAAEDLVGRSRRDRATLLRRGPLAPRLGARHAIAPALLGAVERLVGLGDEVARRLVLGREGRHPEAQASRGSRRRSRHRAPLLRPPGAAARRRSAAPSASALASTIRNSSPP